MVEKQDVLYWIIIIILTMLILIGTLLSVMYFSYKRIIENNKQDFITKLNYQQSLIQVGLDAQELERERIAADLHDNIISKLTIARLKTAIGGNILEIDKLLGIIIEESRRVSHDLSPPLYEEKSIQNNLESILSNWNSFYSVKSYFSVQPNIGIDNKIKLQIVRILQELIHNVHKHAKANEIIFNLRITKNSFSFVLQDNGTGFNTKERKDGIGLKNIDLRANNIGAYYKFKSKEQKGTRVILVLNGKNKFSNS